MNELSNATLWIFAGAIGSVAIVIWEALQGFGLVVY